MLRVEEARAAYGRVEVLKGISLDVSPGEIVALVGANGAGKTTLLRTLSGIHPLASGRVLYSGADISRQSAHYRVKNGIAQVPEGRQVYGPLTVYDNLILGAYVRPQTHVDAEAREMFELFPILGEKRNLPASTLSGGQQQMLALARALMAKPKLLLLDEPSMGLAPIIVNEVFKIIKGLRDNYETTIFLVEQNAHLALQTADRAFVMESGKIVLSGSSEDVRRDPLVQQAYLGM